MEIYLNIEMENLLNVHDNCSNYSSCLLKDLAVLDFSLIDCNEEFVWHAR